MLKFINYLFVLKLLLLSSVLHAEEKANLPVYMKVGVAYPPGNSGCILPTIGIGARFQKDHCGLDISANLNSLVISNYASVKGFFLFYPQYERENQFYFGFGPGAGYHFGFVPMVAPFGRSFRCGNINVEGVVGYEFIHANSKMFIQLEVSQPAIAFKQNGCRFKYTPGVALTTGIGF